MIDFKIYQNCRVNVTISVEILTASNNALTFYSRFFLHNWCYWKELEHVLTFSDALLTCPCAHKFITFSYNLASAFLFLCFKLINHHKDETDQCSSINSIRIVLLLNWDTSKKNTSTKDLLLHHFRTKSKNPFWIKCSIRIS